MIDLTPLEVRKKKGDFRRAMRGYDPQAVDDFLDLVADRLEQLVRDNASMNERLARVEDQVSDYRERERALTEALVTAQEMREEMRKQIDREVELKRREAEADADSIRSEAAQIREREEESIRRLRARQTQFVQSYRSFLERELSELAVMVESLDLNRTPTPSAPARKPRKRERAQEPSESSAQPVQETQQKAAREEPAPMPLPVAIPEPTPMPEAGIASKLESPPVARRQKEVESEPAPDDVDEPEAAGGDRSFDEMLGELAPFAGTAHVTQLEIAESRPVGGAEDWEPYGGEPQPAVAQPAADADADAEAELLADVRAEFDELVAEDLPALEPEPEEEVLDLVDDVADDEDEDGWMSTLLEGKGDQGSK